MTSAGEAQNATLKKQGVQPCDQLHVAGEKNTRLIRERYLTANLQVEQHINTTSLKKAFFIECNDITPYALEIITN
jgi:hypothetical protein